MELSRKEEYRNKKISIAVTALSFLVMIAFLIFKTIITSNAVLVTPVTNELAIGILNENVGQNQEQKSKVTISNTKEESSDNKVVTDPNSAIPVENNATNLINKYKRIKITNTRQTTSTENLLPIYNPTGNEPKSETDGKLGFDLGTRNMVIPPVFDNDTKEEGKVIVEIVVDKDGNVIEANPNGRGTNTSSSLLKAKAKKMAIATKFSQDNKREEQRGRITIIFSFN
ncbi:MAG: hypothetical protein JNJ40_13385 [Bacteroidia bacterium]|nr:hypothetical protein [Bacteroidia bacterium]